MVLTVRLITFVAGLWAVWIIQIIIRENDSKLSHSCGIQVFHLLVFGLDLIFDLVVTFVTIKGSFEIDTAEGSGSNYLLVNTIFFAIAQSLLL